MSDVTVVVPTIPGREVTCRQTVDAYKSQGAEVLIVRGSRTAGEGWAAGLRQAESDYILLGVDDMVPHPGAVEAGLDAAQRGIYPSPRLVLADGSLESCGTLGLGACHLDECPTGTLAYMSSLPFATRVAWERIGEPLPIHYYVDDYLGYMARKAGLHCMTVREYAFTHLDERHGRHHVVARAQEDRARFLAAVSGSREAVAA